MASVASDERALGREEAPRGSRRRRISWEAVVLAGLTVLAGLLLAHYSLKLWTHNLDEDIYRSAGVYTWNHLPESLWSMDASDRGLQRIGSWILGFGLVFFDTPDGFRVARILDVAAYCSTVVPVWLWVRAFGVSRLWAGAAALLSILVPWATVTATFMTENVAYPLAVWALFAIWRAASRPGWTTVAVALLAIFLASLGRSVMILLGVVLIVALIGVGLRCHARGAWQRRSTWRPSQVVLWALLVAAPLGAFVLYQLDPLAFEPIAQGYRVDVGFHWWGLGWLARIALAKTVSGVGILPAIVAAAFIVRAFWRPARPESFALALIAVLTWAFVTYSSMRAGFDERYLMYLAPVMFVCAAVALGRREVDPVLVVLAGIGAVVLFAFQPWNPNQHDYGFIISSAEAFHARVMLQGVGSRLPDVGLSYDAMLAIAILAATAVLAWVLWRRGRGRVARWIGLAMLAGVGVLQLAQTTYVMKHFTAEANFGPPALEDKAWVDRAVDNRDGIAFFASRTGADWEFNDSWREIAFWNMSITKMFIADFSPPNTPAYGRDVASISLNPETGRLSSDQATIPREMVEWRITPVSPLVGTTIAQEDYEPMALVRLDPPARVAWLVSGNDNASWTVPEQTTTIRVYKDTPGPRCLDVVVLGPPGMKGVRRVQIGPRVARVPADQQRALKAIPLRGGPAGHYRDLPVRVSGTTQFPTGQVRGVKIAGIQRAACR